MWIEKNTKKYKIREQIHVNKQKNDNKNNIWQTKTKWRKRNKKNRLMETKSTSKKVEKIKKKKSAKKNWQKKGKLRN